MSERITRILRGLKVKASVQAAEGLVVSGGLEGSIDAAGQRVVIEEDAAVVAPVIARDLLVNGSLVGDVQATGYVEIGATGRVQGAVVARSVRVEPGGGLEGSVRFTEPGGTGTAGAPLPEDARPSAALKSLVETLTPIPHARLLDLGGVSQGTLDRFVSAGHVLHLEDLLSRLARADAEEKSAEAFLEGALRQEPPFDAILCWDALAYAPPSYLGAMAERLHELLRPGGIALAFFPANAAATQAPPGRYELVGPGHVRRRPSPLAHREARFLTRREIERDLGGDFQIRDFLTPGGFHELLLVRRGR